MIEVTPKGPQPSRACKYGQSYTPEYRIWRGLVNRCTSPGDPAWEDYGGRGITVSPEWEADFFEFLGDMGRRPSPGHEIDRRDNELGYSRHNCRWVSRKVNSRNRRSAHMVTFRGQRVCLAEACEMAGVSYTLVQKRLESKREWSLEDAILTPARAKAANGCAVPKCKPRSNKNGYPNIKARAGKYHARVQINGKRIQTKGYATPEEAHKAYEQIIRAGGC